MSNGIPRTTSFLDPLSGHLNNLNETQTIAFDEMKTQLATDYPQYFKIEHGQQSVEDSVLLRFLRARKFDVEGGIKQFIGTAEWRETAHVAELYDTTSIQDFKATSVVHPCFTGRRNKAGLPLYVFKVSALTKDVISEYNKAGQEKLDKRMIALYEHMVQFVLPFTTELPRPPPYSTAPISSTVTLVDVSNVSFSSFFGLRKHMQQASVLATAHYAECTGAIYIVGAPSFFSVVWGWVGKWFDPVTVAKIQIINSDVFGTLSKHIDPENIPIAYGGTLPYEYGDEPILDKDMQDLLGLKELPKGSIRWINSELVLEGTGRSEAEIELVEKAVSEKKASAVSTPVGEEEEEVVKPNGDVKEETEVETLPVEAEVVALEGKLEATSL